MVVDVVAQPDSDLPEARHRIEPLPHDGPWPARSALGGPGASRISGELLGVLGTWLRFRRPGPRRPVAPAYRRGRTP